MPEQAGADGTAPAGFPLALDPRLYRDPAVLEAEVDAIFSRTWQYAGHVGDLPEAGNYITARAGDQPVLVLRGDDGGLRAFRNVCRHRGSELLTGSGRCKKAIRCRYHGWTYDATDGRLLGVPEHREYGERLDKSALGLIPARVEELAGLLFVNLDRDAAPLAEATAGLAERLAPYRIPELAKFASSKGGGSESTQPANWKIVVENYLEGYHVPIAHPGLMRMLDYKGYGAELHDGWTWFDAPLRDEPSGNRLERLYQRLVRPMPGLYGGGEPELVLRLRLSEHRDRSLPGPGQRLADPAGGSRADGRQLVLLSRSRFGPGGPAGAADQQQVQQPGARRGHRPGRARPDGYPHAWLRSRSAGRQGGRGGLVRRPCARRPR